jgi:CubicO group peptidase (beta-lactamase class C family)
VRSKVTIDQLLHHRSGIGSFWNERFLASHAEVRTTRDYLDLFDRDSLLFAPGSSDMYSNGGYVVLGAIIERVTGQSYHDYVRQHIFEPASMTSTGPYDSQLKLANDALGYTAQSPDGPVTGDRRLAGAGPRPGDAGPARLLIIGPDGKQLNPEEARAAVAQHNPGTQGLRPNTAFEAGVSGPAGDDFSTVGDLLRLANALVSHRLLDAAHTSAVLGSRFSQGGEFRANGGGPGVNAELSIYPNGYVIAVLSNYDPPAATAVAQAIRSLVASASRPGVLP